MVSMSLGTSRPGDMEYGTACLARRGDCSDMKMGFGDDVCFGANLLCQGAVAEAMTCLTGACDTIVDCIIEAFTQG
jgi:hypothetical protein